jgi:hypothetical protein
MDSTKKQTLLETYHKEQLCRRQLKQNATAVARAAQYLEDNDIKGLYSLLTDLHSDTDNRELEKDINLEDSE